MRSRRRLRKHTPDEDRRFLDPDRAHRADRADRAPLQEKHRSLVAAVDAAIAVVAGSAALPAGEVVDLLLDLRTRIASTPA